MRKRIAIITARGGSKRIPKKNIRNFCGKPIICYSIDAALRSGLFEEVMVSTDDEEIAEISRHAGASVPFMRSEETAGDHATTTDVLKEVLGEYRKRGEEFEEVVCIYPTAPFITSKKLREAVGLMEESGADSVTPVVKFSYPPQRALLIREEMLVYQYPEYTAARSQDLEPIYHDCGQFYVMKSRNVLDDEKDIKSMPYIISDLEVQDIDDEEDWKLAELKYKMLRND